MAKKQAPAATNDEAELALFRDVKEQYDDDGPLLALAEWLDRNGDPDKADNLRYYLAEDAHLPRPKPPPGKRPRDKAAIERRQKTGAAIVAGHPHQHCRGMTRLHVDPERLATGYLDAAIDANPTGWPWIDGLVFQGKMTAAAFRWLLDWPRLGDLNYLDFGSCHLGLTRLRDLTGCPLVRRVADLSTGEEVNTLSPEGVAALAVTPLFGRLTRLTLRLSDPAEAARALAQVRLPRLRRLSFTMRRGDPLGPAGALALVQAGWLSGLRQLSLMKQDIGDEGAVALAGSPALAGLQVLDLYHNDVGLDGARALADSPHLGNLALLRVYSTRLGKRGVQVLKARFGERAQC